MIMLPILPHLYISFKGAERMYFLSLGVKGWKKDEITIW